MKIWGIYLDKFVPSNIKNITQNLDENLINE